MVDTGTRKARAISSVVRLASKTQRERDTRLRREDRMAGNEHEAQEVVTHVVIGRGFEICHCHLLLDFELAAELFVFAFKPLVAAQAIDSAMFRGGHEPGARIVRDT